MAKRAAKKGKQVMAHTVEVWTDNPLWSAAHDGAKANPRKIRATLSMAESPVLWMHCHNQVDDSHLAVAGRFRALFERTGGAGVSAMDPTREPVQGGKRSDGITDAKQSAAKELEAVRNRIGRDGYELVEAVCGQCRWLKDLFPSKRVQLRKAAELRGYLEDLALFWGMVNRKRDVA